MSEMSVLFFLLWIFWPILLCVSFTGLKLSYHKWKKYLAFLIVSLFIVVYSFNPKVQMDLTVYFNQLEHIKYLSLKGMLEYFDDGLFVKDFVFWIISKSGCKHLLPALSTTLVYGIAFYITCDTAKRYHSEKLILYVMLFQWIILPFTSLISNVRNVCSFSLIILAAYRDIVKGKTDFLTILLYFLPCFIHTSAVIIVMIRLSLFLIGKIRIIAITIIAMFPAIITFLYQNNIFSDSMGTVGKVLDTLIRQGYAYLNDTGLSEYAREIKNSIAQNIDKVMRIVIMLWMIYLMHLFEKKVKGEDKKFWHFLFYICAMTIACGWITVPHYWRFASAAVVAGGSLFIPVLEQCRKQENRWICKCLMVPIPMFLLWAAAFRIRNNYIMVDYSEWIRTALRTNVYTILFDIFKGGLSGRIK